MEKGRRKQRDIGKRKKNIGSCVSRRKEKKMINGKKRQSR